MFDTVLLLEQSTGDLQHNSLMELNELNISYRATERPMRPLRTRLKILSEFLIHNETLNDVYSKL